MIDLLSMNCEEMIVLAKDAGYPGFRGKQLFQWIHEKEVFDFSEMTNLPIDFREFLKTNTQIKRGILEKQSVSSDRSTVKFLLKFDDEYIETVLMHYERKEARNRYTLCVSTQAGCGMGCKFCATGQGGLRRNLLVGEIIDQVNFANAYLKQNALGTVTNLVYMGMGEPLANYEASLKSIRIINKAKDIGMRRITVSTCGLIPQIKELAKENLQLTLAVSLHQADEIKRAAIMPINKKYPLQELFPVLDNYIESTGRRITLEYALFQNLNDSQKDAVNLVNRIQGKKYHVNLVPGNPVENTNMNTSPQENIKSFASILSENGIEVSIRESKGRDINGACGQLRAKLIKENKRIP